MKTDSMTATIDAIANECLAVRIRLLNRTVTNIFDDALRPLGVKVSQLNVLVVVAKCGPVSPGQVCSLLNLEKSTLSRNVDRMQARGWLKLSEGDSARRQIIEIAPAGRRLIEKVLPFWKEAQAKTENLLGQRGAQSIYRAAETVWAKLGRT